jgi:hypothetical protein
VAGFPDLRAGAQRDKKALKEKSADVAIRALHFAIPLAQNE